MSFHFWAINLGCSKNLVDLEHAIGEILKFSDRADVQFYSDPEDEDVDYVLINTCGFLGSARTESEQTLQHYNDLGKKLILMGCYVSVKDDAFLSGLKNLDTILSFVDYASLERLILGREGMMSKLMPKLESIQSRVKNAKEARLNAYLERVGGSQLSKKAFVWKGDEVRAYFHAPFRYEYLKIAEGCDNNCTFCIIPKIRGRQSSRAIADVLREVDTMLWQGIREIEIIAQDTTRYGTDFLGGNGESQLFELLEQLEAHPWDFRYRVFYLYPDTLTLSHLEKLTKFKKFIPYFDVPFQHASEKILRLMGRHYDRRHIDDFLAFIRQRFPESIVRTSFIVGFPGESEEDFAILKDFVITNRFESIGVFEYHDEQMAASSKLPDKIDDATVHARREILGEIIDSIYSEQALARVGLQRRGYIMELREKTAIIRDELRAPEIDEYDEVSWNDIDCKKSEATLGRYVSYRIGKYTPQQREKGACEH